LQLLHIGQQLGLVKLAIDIIEHERKSDHELSGHRQDRGFHQQCLQNLHLGSTLDDNLWEMLSLLLLQLTLGMKHLTMRFHQTRSAVMAAQIQSCEV
jgi:hypothetical protein